MGVIEQAEGWLASVAIRKASTDGVKALGAFIVATLAKPDVAQHLSAAGVSITIDPKAMQVALGGATAFALGWIHDYLKMKYPNLIKF